MRAVRVKTVLIIFVSLVAQYPILKKQMFVEVNNEYRQQNPTSESPSKEIIQMHFPLMFYG